MGLRERALPLINDAALKRPTSPLRGPLLARASGVVVELGFGSGLNASHYGAGVARVVAVEPSDAMWARGEARAREAGLRVERVRAFGEALPLPASSADVAVVTYVLCSVRDPARVLAELARVVKPGGRLLVLEHVRDPGPLTARVQSLLRGIFRAALSGCEPDRDLLATLRGTPWAPEELREIDVAGLPRLVRHNLVGALVRR